ncbi:hypothetical protein [Mycolicibacterium senegalense]|uniref:hypothetical protein n=1 Tax=Mycolicibacterium senegalense TaxID=1796 RepID=UPI00363AE235
MTSSKTSRLQIEDEVDNILHTVPRDVYTDEEVVALAVLLRPVYERHLAEARPPARILRLSPGGTD